MAPRNVLKRVVALYEAEGWRPVVAPEMEFYLIKPNLNPNEPIEPPLGRTGRQMVSRQAYSMSAVDEYGKVIDDIYEFAEAQGFEIDTIIQEGGAGQVEINLLHGDPVKLADQVFFFKRTIREAALRNNCFATFMAKPMQEEPGSAMHIHQSVVDVEDRRGTSSPTRRGRRPRPSTASSPGSSGTSRPWSACSRPTSTATAATCRTARRRSTSNGGRTTAPRASGCRSPSRRRGGSRTGSSGWTATPTSRSPPSLACGYLGMKAKLKPREPVAGEAYHRPRALPRDLLAALDLFEECPEITEVLGAEFCNLYKAIKRDEVETFLRVISPWERDHLLLNVYFEADGTDVAIAVLLLKSSYR